MADDSADAFMTPPTKSVTARGETIKIAPLQVRQIPPFAREIRFALPGFMRLFGASGVEDGSFELAFLDLIADHGEAMQHAVAIAADRDPEWVGAMDLDEFMILARAVVEVNSDFFRQKVTGSLQELRSQTAALSNGDGPTQSTS